MNMKQQNYRRYEADRGCASSPSCSVRPGSNDKKKLYSMIQSYSFVINETALYLDTHPNCRQALRHYEKYRKLLADAIQMYEENYGPMTIFGCGRCDSWKWVEEAWPWES